MVGIDIGGTFTDLCAIEGERVRRAKVPTTPDDVIRGVMQGLELLGAEAGFTLVAGSTVATNTLLERTGARVGFIATEGFSDLLQIGRQNRPDLYALHVRRPAALVGAADCFSVRERLDADGHVLVPLDDAAVATALEDIRTRGIESVAICLLFSYLNPTHEQRIAELAAELGLASCCSSTLLPEFREFERASTTVVNAYVAPRTSDYLRSLDRASRQAGARDIRVMLSNGGQTSPLDAAREPVRTILAGPAGGAIAAARAAGLLGMRRVLTYDMGGTSTDVAQCDGEVAVTSEAVLAGWPIRVPQLAIHTVGQGGGSIAALDSGGMLSVGPRSAGAVPGPACYGVGTEATVTDANVVLGRIVPERFLGGRLPLSPQRSSEAVGRIARSMGCSLELAADAIVTVANAGMEHALRVVSAHRGVDPADYWLVSFGGAGGLHAAALAGSLRMAGVIVPPDPGILSATGMILADVVKDVSRTLPRSSRGGIDLELIRREFGRLMDAAAEAVFRDGFDLDDTVCHRLVDLRYVGQSYELTVPVESLTDEARLTAPFHRAHAARYGACEEQAAVEAVTLRVRAVVETPKPMPPELPPAQGTPPRAIGRTGTASVYARESLLAGHELRGPCLIVEDHATTWLPPDWKCTVERLGHLRIVAG